MSLPIGPATIAALSIRCFPDLLAHLSALPAQARILELGTKQSIPGRSTHHKEWAPHARWTLADFQDGEDVDIVADAHRLEDVFPCGTFDAVVSCSTFEHIQRPWLAAASIAKVMAPGAVVFIQTHNAFPIHSYPSDYWRFSEEALRTLLEDAGLVVAATWYSHRSHVVTIPGRLWPTRELKECLVRAKMPAHLNVYAVAVKP
jgi:SAM-dependent methyltransferase